MRKLLLASDSMKLRDAITAAQHLEIILMNLRRNGHGILVPCKEPLIEEHEKVKQMRRVVACVCQIENEWEIDK